MLKLIFIVITLALRSGMSEAYSYPPPTTGYFEESALTSTSKLQQCHVIANSFIDGANFLTCLVKQKQKFTTCDPISLFYQAMDIQINEVKQLSNNDLSKENLFNFIGSNNKVAWQRLRDIPAKCQILDLDCSHHQDDHSSLNSYNVPNEVIEIIEHSKHAGSLMLKLLDNNPNDLTLNAFEDILDNCVLDVHRSNTGSGTSVGVILLQVKKIIKDIEKLDSGHHEVPSTSKLQQCHTVANSFIEGANLLKCLTRQQFASCDPIGLLYQAMDIEINEVKKLNNNELTKDNLFNFIGSNNEFALQSVRDIPAKCLGHDIDCSRQDLLDSAIAGNIPQEIMDMIAQSQHAGSLMLQVLDNNPSDSTLNSIEDILDNCVLDIHRGTIGSGTSIGFMMAQVQKIIIAVGKLVPGHQQITAHVTPSSKLQQCHAIANSFIDGSNILKCLTRKQLATCDPIKHFYQAMDLEVSEVKKLNNNDLVQANVLNLISIIDERFLKRLNDIPSQCVGHTYDCSHQNDQNEYENVPQEVGELIDATHLFGTLMLQLLDNKPSDMTFRAIENILDNCVIDVHRGDIGTGTSVGLVLSQIKKMVHEMQNLITSPNPLQVYQTIAASFVETSNIIKCLTRKHFPTCNAVADIYGALDTEVYEDKANINADLTRSDKVNYVSHRFPMFDANLRAIAKKCTGGHVEVHCDDDHNQESASNVEIPHELKAFIEQFSETGVRLQRLLHNSPSDLILNAIGEILDFLVVQVHDGNVETSTSVGIVLDQALKINHKLQKLELAIAR